MKNLKIITALFLSLTVAACGGSSGGASADIQETAQQVGDVMASVDESSGVENGAYARLESQGLEQRFARLLPPKSLREHARSLFSAVVPPVYAAGCGGTTTFGACTNNVVLRNFDECTIGSTTLDGTIMLTWDDGVVDNTCTLDSDGDSITRDPNFTLTGRRGGTMTVTKTATFGQRLTRLGSGVFGLTSDGIRRVIAFQGTSLFDFTSETTGELTVSGTSRSGRVLTSTTGAGIKVTNNLSGVNCTFVPTDVTWTGTCNCATSGSWSGSCSDSTSAALEITGCGTALFIMGTETENVTFDRCYSL